MVEHMLTYFNKISFFLFTHNKAKNLFTDNFFVSICFKILVFNFFL